VTPATKAGQRLVDGYRRMAAVGRTFIVFPDEVALIEAEARAAALSEVRTAVEGLTWVGTNAAGTEHAVSRPQVLAAIDRLSEPRP
jgi:hypothetical protein